MPNRYVLTVTGNVREQYIVEAESVEDAEACFARGEYLFPVVSEVSDAELVDVTQIGGVIEPQPRMSDRNQSAWRRVNARRES